MCECNFGLPGVARAQPSVAEQGSAWREGSPWQEANLAAAVRCDELHKEERTGGRAAGNSTGKGVGVRTNAHTAERSYIEAKSKDRSARKKDLLNHLSC